MMAAEAHDDATCGCCTGAAPTTALVIDPPPGLGRIPRRIGTHGSFLARLVAGLPEHPPTRALTSRDRADTALALLDGWAVVADELTFYTEQIANEHYIRTATERRSVGELGRLIGRSLRPGLAAEVDLALTMDATPGAPPALVVQPGVGVQSEPEPGTDPAVFETIETIEVRPAWNRLRVRSATAQVLTASSNVVHLAGNSTKLRRGDGIAFRAGGAVQFGIVNGVTVVDPVPPKPDDPGRPGSTIVTCTLAKPIDSGLPASAAVGTDAAAGPLTGAAGWLAGRVVTAAQLAAEAAERRVALSEIEASVAGAGVQPGSVVAFRTVAALFGAQAPDSNSLATSLKQELKTLGGSNTAFVNQVNSIVSGNVFPWSTATASTMPATPSGSIRLDNAHPTVTAGNVVVLTAGGNAAAYLVSSARVEGFANAGVSGKSTLLALANTLQLGLFGVRPTAVHGDPERLDLAALPDVPLSSTAIPSTSVELDGLALGLTPGRRVALTGSVAGDRGTTVVHVTSLAEVTHDFVNRRTRLALAQAPPKALDPATSTVNANVVRGSHGQTRQEVIGSGDSRLVFQTFKLSQRPLTYLSAPTAAGQVSTLRVYVDELQWHEVPELLTASPTSRVFVTHETEDGTSIQFGDGINGARLPSGNANVRAVYRAGAGTAGRIPADRATVLMSRPAGLRAATNPQASRGGTAPETVEQARSNIAVGVRTLGRVVSLRDYEDFARSFPGVAKAQATWARVGSRRGVIVTVAGPDGGALEPGNPVRDSLVLAFGAAGADLIRAHPVSFQPLWFRVALALRLDPDRSAEGVRAEADARLHAAFGFEARELGQAVAASEVLAVVQGTPGVIAADLTTFSYVTGQSVSTTVPDRLDASTPSAGVILTASAGGWSIPAARLLTIESRPIVFGDLR